MRVDIDVDLGDLTRFGEAAGDLDAAVARGVRAETGVMFRIVERQTGRIYSRTIPRSATGRPMWERSGDLLNGLEQQFPSGTEGQIVVEGEAAVYATRRHQLGEPTNEYGPGWTPANPAGGVIRNNPFVKQAEEITRPQRGEVLEQEIKNALGIRG